MPNTVISPETMLRVVAFTLVGEFGAAAFSLAVEMRSLCTNAAVQYGTYIGAQAVGNTVPVFLPVIANTRLIQHYVTASAGGTPAEKALSVGLLFSAAGVLTRTSDVPTNMAVGALIAS